jgi:FAD/FMN-containing dehydrogenase
MVMLKDLSAFVGFPKDFRGNLFQPGDRGYGPARQIYNMRWRTDEPALIARPADAEDVAHIMRYASTMAMPVAVRSGGHGVDGTAMPDGQLVVDLSQFREIHVDPAMRTVRAGAGILLGDLDKACQEHGLVVPAGTVSTTGIAGRTLGGGVGYNMRCFGATVDNLLSCEVVTADGRLIKASKAENPELFWALCGAGSNFGVVTAFEYRAHPVGPAVGAVIVL